ncbi:GGDEF domain-containing protein [Vibrio rhodolitus]|uniref:GGDEF domain-containing protein n=1 Tax=Vibrio rhodolitus TaxID=2231649 RepID=UPI001ABF5525|nr:GGDEF domain-containing protein [Vibrio rhodolitus]
MNGIHKLIFALFVFTVFIITLHWQFGEQKSYRVSPNDFAFLPTNDQIQKGASTSVLEQNGEAIQLNCELKKSPDYKWPYCGISIQLNKDAVERGLDLSDFHTVKLDVDFIRLDSDKKPALRFYLRNYNPAYSATDNEYTHKYNGLDYRQADYSQPLTIPLKNLQVLTWWLVDNQIPIEHSGPEFNNVTRIEFATGSGAEEGLYQLNINSIEFIGYYIHKETLMLLLLMIWVGFAITFSAMEIRNGRLKVMQSESRRAYLQELNHKLKKQNIQFAEQAHRDALTGAMNRHSVREWLEKQFNSYVKPTDPLSVIYLDIDHFKHVNDRFGHKVGDDILREFTMVVMSELRATDRLVRWGGEEFVVFCQSTSLKQAYMLAERLRQKIELYQWMHGEVLTASLGVAQMGDETPQDMVTRADELLYKAKRGGRNRVEVSGLEA